MLVSCIFSFSHNVLHPSERHILIMSHDCILMSAIAFKFARSRKSLSLYFLLKIEYF